MNHQPRTVLLVTAVVSAAVGLVFLVLPAGFGDPQVGPLELSAPPAPLALVAANPALAEDVVLANIFSTRRGPPTTRYSPPDASVDSSGGMVADPTLVAGVDAEAPGEPLLLGTVVGAGGTRALLQLDRVAGTPRLYAAGDRDGGYRVISIAPRAVILAGPRGRVTLRLDPEEERP